jgi:vancomycin resistance protein YoaR
MFIFVFIALTSLTILLSSSYINSANHKNLKIGSLANVPEKPVGGNTQPGKATKSGQITSLPWEDDENFKAALENNSKPVLMAAYRTVLRDPLPGEENNVHLAARLLTGTVVKPGEIFSQNNNVGPYSEAKGFQKGPVYLGSQLSTTIGGGVCKLASTLYNVAVLSNLPIVERYNHGMPVPYVPYGQDATVSYGCKDIKFMNNTSFPILIWAQGIDNVLYIGFYGKSKPPRVVWHHKYLKVIDTHKIYRSNPALPPGSEKVVLEGMKGAIVNSWVTIYNKDGTSKIKKLGRSYYNPMPYIVEKGAAPASSQ